MPHSRISTGRPIMMNIEAVDLFCGVGGLTAGLIQSGITVKAGYDIEPSCRFGYEHNNNAKFVLKDVADVTADEVNSWYSKGAVRLLAGCAPCQPFSTYSQARDATMDKKYPLLYHFARLIEEVSPELVTMENVPDVIKHQVYHDFVAKLEALGYSISANQVDCVQYGIPQTRKRHVLIASRLSDQISLIPPTYQQPVTVRDVISGLPPLQAGEHDELDALHYCAGLTAINLKRIKASKPGGSWHDWDEDLRVCCHKKASGKGYGSVYGRMEWDKPAPTMTTQCYGFGNGRFGHPEQHRAISLREAALFQTFPKDYQFFDEKSTTMNISQLGRMIGNAVPVRLGEVVGMSLLRAS